MLESTGRASRPSADATKILLRTERLTDAGTPLSVDGADLALVTSGFARWLEVTLTMDATNKKATLDVAGERAVSVTLSDWLFDDAYVDIGPACTGDVDVRVDDVAVFATP